MKHKGLKRQGSLYIVIVLCVAAAAVFLPWLWSQSPYCTEHPAEFREDFDDTGYKDFPNSISIANWPSGPIMLNRLGANFVMASPTGMGANIYVCAAGDFTGDGFPDLIGLDITRQRSGQTNPMSRLVLIRNQYETHGHAAPFAVDTTKVFDEFNTHTGPASITAGDYNNDGLLDFFFMRNSADEFGYTNFLAVMYINVGTPLEPEFRPYNMSPNLDFTARFQAAGIPINWAADHLHSVDIDKEGDIDILVISRNMIFLVRNPVTTGNFGLMDFAIGELNYDFPTGFDVGAGGSAVTAADFDNDGDIDILGGSVVGTVDFLVYYENDGFGRFTRKEIDIPDPTCRGVVGILGTDFTNNGLPDIFVATDSAYGAYPSGPAKMWIMRNNGMIDVIDDTVDPPVTASVLGLDFQCLNDCQPIIPPYYDVDMSTPIDYDQDGDIDVVIADANHSGDYYLVINELAGVFGLYGEARSTNVARGVVDPRRHAIARVRVTRLLQDYWSPPGYPSPQSDGLVVELWFTNDGGVSWMRYHSFEDSQIANTTNMPWRDFSSFGADLRWKVVMRAQRDDMVEHENASFETPRIDLVELEYIYVDRMEYSRASAAATIITREGIDKKLVIGASFIFPGWEGQLRAYDVSAVALTADPYSSLTTLSSSNLTASEGRNVFLGTEIFWDAGRILNDRDPDTRTIYAAIRANASMANPLTRVDFTSANADVLCPMFFTDKDNDDTGLIDFVRGKGRYWVLGDINHSTPVVVGPPDGDPTYMGAGYAAFSTSYADRPKVLYVGANDGMLHCFDASTGQELWGFIPYNLLPRLPDMWAVDEENGTRFFNRGVYVDGSPSVADVQIGGQWRTVLVSGQGPGSGSALAGGLNYYWALDVTDPENPQPLWEITHRDGQNRITMGETWSVPAIGKINHSGTPRWVAFMGSGYDNDPAADLAGTRFYVVRLDTGSIVRAFTVANVNTWFTGTKSAYRYENIRAIIPGSPTAVDTNGDGFTDWVYVGDLDGRLYRLDVTRANPSNWAMNAIYTDYLNYPIITKPAVWVDPYAGNPIPKIYFGTGGHEKGLGGFSPTIPNHDWLSDREFSFVSILDEGLNAATVEWYLGNPTLLNRSADLRVGELGVGYRVWADPQIANGIVYFSTLRGNIESGYPCENLGGAGRLYARFIRQTSSIPAGGTAFKSADATPPEYLDLVSKARRAVTLGEAQRVGGRTSKREVYVQQYDSTIEILEQPIGSLLRIKSWREVYRIIW